MNDQTHRRTVEDLESRRRDLQRELQSLEASLEQNFDSIQDEVNVRMTPAYWVRKHPIRMVGLAVMLGFLAGSKDKSDAVAGTSMSAAVMGALKSVAARKIVDHVVKMVEDQTDN
jgi:hypothetical protein